MAEKRHGPFPELTENAAELIGLQRGVGGELGDGAGGITLAGAHVDRFCGEILWFEIAVVLVHCLLPRPHIFGPRIFVMGEIVVNFGPAIMSPKMTSLPRLACDLA